MQFFTALVLAVTIIMAQVFFSTVSAQNGDTIIIGPQHGKHHHGHHGCHCAHYTPIHEPHIEHGHDDHYGHGHHGHDGIFRRKRSIIRIVTVPARQAIAIKAAKQ